MSRLLLLVAVLLVVLWALQRGAQGRRRQARRETPRADASGEASRAIVPCAHCGVHLPVAEAIEADGRMYCSHAHVSLARHGDR
ncbi:MAG TPA: PP0621 family protein [Burkholderiaceae bacterium]|nr:PP0621 family protein [Burkholderiaceae bacterium]